MTKKPEGKWYEVLEQSYIGDRIYQAGERVQFSGEAGPNLRELSAKELQGPERDKTDDDLLIEREHDLDVREKDLNAREDKLNDREKVVIEREQELENLGRASDERAKALDEREEAVLAKENLQLLKKK